jgi:hypothetical protein
VREKLHEIVIAGYSFSRSGNKSVCHYFSKSTAADNSAGVYLHKYQDQKKFLPWKTWLRIAAQPKLRLVGWPDGVLSPGPDLALRKLSANDVEEAAEMEYEDDYDQVETRHARDSYNRYY